MNRGFARLLFALAGGVSGMIMVALLEARQAAGAAMSAHTLPLAFRAQLVLAEVGVLAPVALMVAALVCAVSFFLEPHRPVPLAERLADVRRQPVLARRQVAALAPLFAVAACGWVVVTAHSARWALSRGSPMAAGVALATASLALLTSFAAVAFALLPRIRRQLAVVAARWPRAIDPVTTGAVGIALAILVIAFGAFIGDSGGAGPTPLAIFGVLRRGELDLRPVIDAAAIGMCAWQGSMALGRRRLRPRGVSWAAGIIIGSMAVTVYEASALNRAPSLAQVIESHAPLGRLALSLARKVTDRDHDGASPLFGGGDCNDRDPNISPLAIDIPGNGVDEDCSGGDLAPAAAPLRADELPRAAVHDAAINRFNVLFITIDTLRATEMGFLGYPKPTTPHLDALASTAVVFERAYSLASYTGKALAPMLIGKYPSETYRDGGHFNKYFASNTFLAERLREAGLYTMGAASHWYFRESYGLTQGFDVFDLSAVPKVGQGETDTSVTSPALTEAAVKLLRAHAGSRRFFMWVHYFDPHEQYIAHDEAPDFADPARPNGWRMRALYDGEVWFTDKYIGRLLDYVDAQPWGKNTIVVVTSDHGEAMNEHGIAFQHGFEIWEPLVRVPLIVRVPGIAPHRVGVKRSVIDLVPTLLDLLGLPQPPGGELSGQSMTGDFAVTRASDMERDVYLDMPEGPFTHMRRGIIHGATPGLKLIHFGGRRYQLYDLERDPDENDDIATDASRLAPMLEAFSAKRATLREIAVKSDIAP